MVCIKSRTGEITRRALRERKARMPPKRPIKIESGTATATSDSVTDVFSQYPVTTMYRMAKAPNKASLGPRAAKPNAETSMIIEGQASQSRTLRTMPSGPVSNHVTARNSVRKFAVNHSVAASTQAAKGTSAFGGSSEMSKASTVKIRATTARLSTQGQVRNGDGL